MLIVGMGNHYGDVDIAAGMNLLIPATHRFLDGKDVRLPRDQPIRTLTTTERFDKYPHVEEWRYAFATVNLRRGEHVLYHGRIDVKRERGDTMPVIVRLDHVDLRGGREQHDELVARGEISPLTTSR